MTKEQRRRQKPRDNELAMEPPRQANLQFVDDTWERLLNALERFEQADEQFRNISARRLDEHSDRDNLQEHKAGIQVEIHLQIKCLQRVIHPVRNEGAWLIDDFLGWFGGREGRPLSLVDEYAKPILQCILAESYTLPALPPATAFSERDILVASQNLGVGMHRTDKIVEEFMSNPERSATRHQHQRGTVAQGSKRLASLPDEWTRDFVKRVKAGILLKKDQDIISKAGQFLSKLMSPQSEQADTRHPDAGQSLASPPVVRCQPENRLEGLKFMTYPQGGVRKLLDNDTRYGCPRCGTWTWCKAAAKQSKSLSNQHSFMAVLDREMEHKAAPDIKMFDFTCSGCSLPVRIVYAVVDLGSSIKGFEALYILELQ
jgi:hypothetical protein